MEEEIKVSPIGKLIDSTDEVFREELEKQQVNVGTMKNMSLYLSMTWEDLRVKKDGIIHIIVENKPGTDGGALRDTLQGIYMEMVKIENKVTILNEKIAVLENISN